MRVILLAMAAAAALAVPGNAQLLASTQEGDPIRLKSLSLEELSKIEVVTTSKEPSPVFRTPAAAYVLTDVDIRRSGATNIPDLLRLVPGVEVAQIDSAKWAVGIRGFQGRLSKSVLVLIDGRSVYTPLFAGVYWEMQDTMIEDIDRIEVIRGPGATIWGANAVNGVINIITKSAKDTHGTLVTGGGGNVEQGFLNARYGAGNDRLSYRVYGRGFTRGPQFHPDGRNFDDWRRVQTGFRIDSTRGRDSFTILGNAYTSTVGTKLGITTYSPPAFFNQESNGTFSGQNFVGTWRRALKSGSDFQIRAYYDRTDRDDLNYREVRHTVDVDFIHHAALGSHDVIWGAGARISPSRFTQVVPTVDFLPHEQTYSIYSGFFQDTVSLVPNRLSFTVGTKLEHNSFSGFEYQPSGRVAWTPTDRQTVWAAATRAVRTPARTEQGFSYSLLYDAKTPSFVRLIGDDQFTPEQMVGYEAGYRLFSPKAGGFVSIAGFYNRYDDLLSVELHPFEETTVTPPRTILALYSRNGIAAETGGVEISSLMDLRPWWRMNGSYSLMRLNASRYPSSIDLSTVGQLEGSSPRHKVVVQSTFTLPASVEFSATYRYVSAIVSGDVRAPDYSTADVRLARRLGRSLELSLAGRNLLQPSHFEYGAVAVRRSAYLQLTWVTAGR